MLTFFGPTGGLHPGCSHGHLKEVERWTVNQASIRPDCLSRMSISFSSLLCKSEPFYCFSVWISVRYLKMDLHKTPPDYIVYHQTYCKYKHIHVHFRSHWPGSNCEVEKCKTSTFSLPSIHTHPPNVLECSSEITVKKLKIFSCCYDLPSYNERCCFEIN